MPKTIFLFVLFLSFGFLFTDSQTAFCQNTYINVNLTAKQALKKKFKWCKVISTVKYGYKTVARRHKRQVLTREKLNILENSYTSLIKLGLSNKTVNKKTPRDSFLLLFPNNQKINDSSFYLFALPKRDTSFLITNLMGSHPWFEPQAIYFDSSGKIIKITSGGGAGEECCGGGDRWNQTVWFKNNICYSSTRHTQQPNEEIETEWDPSHSFPLTITKNKGIDVGYSKTTFSYFFRKGILYKLTELIEDKTSDKKTTIVYKYHYKKNASTHFEN